MNWLRKIFRGQGSEVGGRNFNLNDPDWPEKQRAMFAVMGSLPEDDALMIGLLAWQDARMANLVADCTNPNLTSEQALTLAHRIAEVSDWREALRTTWRTQRALSLAGVK